mgnify:CR=1 FL=1
MKVANQEVTLIDYMGTDLSIVNAARVSFDKESEYYSLIDNADQNTLEETDFSAGWPNNN